MLFPLAHLSPPPVESVMGGGQTSPLSGAGNSGTGLFLPCTGIRGYSTSPFEGQVGSGLSRRALARQGEKWIRPRHVRTPS